MQQHSDDAPEFTDDELRAAAKRASDAARAEAFAAGLPVMYLEHGRLVLRHPDGRVEDVGPAHASAISSA